MEAKFGREGSPVLYINPPYWTNQASNWVKREEYSPRKYTENERSKNVSRDQADTERHETRRA